MSESDPQYVECKPPKRWDPEEEVWDFSAPFFLSPTAHLVHRVKGLATHHGRVDPGRLLVEYWCENYSSKGNDEMLLFEVPAGRMVCQRCEAMAIAAGEKSSDELNGRHVHIGRMVPQQVCCKGEKIA